MELFAADGHDAGGCERVTGKSGMRPLRRVLKPTGSLYLHCDPTANAYLRMLCDAVFGVGNLRRELVWSNEDRSGFKSKAKNWIRGHDTLLYYAGEQQGYTFNKQYRPLSEATIRRYDKVDEEGVRYKIYRDAKGQERRVNLNENRGAGISSVWGDVPSFQTVNNTGEQVGYPTQKPLALLDRIIKASSNAGDVVLDPFCGCATACVSAESLGRQWVGIDLSEVAAKLVESRLRDQFGVFGQVHHRQDVPRRTDLGDLPNYRTHKHHLFGIQEGRCAGCRMVFPFRNFDVDHVIPQSRGGSDHRENLQLLCPACNRLKGTSSQAELIAKLKERRLLAA